MTNATTWYRIRNAAGSAEVDIFDAIGWYGVDAGQFARDVRALDAQQITVNINSPGGDVFDGVTILNALRQHPARTVANVMGLAASAASFIACGCDEVVMAENSTLMIHDASGIVIGNAQDMTEMAAVLDQISDNIASIYAAKAGGAPENWRAVMRGEKWYTAQVAVDAGLADRVDKGHEAQTTDDDKAKASNLTPKPHTLAEARAALALIVQPSMRAPGTEPANLPDGITNREEGAMASDTFLAGLRERLGITDVASDEAAILAALDEALAEQADPAPTAGLPAGVVAIETGVLDQLKADASAGRQALANQQSAHRDLLITNALKAGKITAAQRKQWRDALDENEAGITALLDTLAATVPVDAKAVTTPEDDLSADDSNYDAIYNPTKEA